MIFKPEVRTHILKPAYNDPTHSLVIQVTLTINQPKDAAILYDYLVGYPIEQLTEEQNKEILNKIEEFIKLSDEEVK